MTYNLSLIIFLLANLADDRTRQINRFLLNDTDLFSFLPLSNATVLVQW